jgi:acyl-CoA thioester hydrolase
MPNAFHYKRRVEFCDTDAAGIVHFSALMQMAEQAEHAMLRSLGTSVLVHLPSDAGEHRMLTWPRVRMECEFHGAARFEEELDISLYVSRLGTKSVTYTFRMTRSSEPICSGRATSVCCQIDSTGRMKSVEIPARLKDQLQAYVVSD